MPVVTMPDGVPVAFPDDMPPDQIRALILKKFPDAAQTAATSVPAPAASAAAGVPAPQKEAFAEPSNPREVVSPWVQGLGAAATDIQDTASMLNPLLAVPAAVRMGASIASRVTGTPSMASSVPALPSSSESLSEAANTVTNGLGYRTVPDSQMETADRLKYNTARIVSQAVAGAPMMAKAATARAADLARGAVPGFFDKVLSAYMGQNVGRTVAGDIAGAGGAAAGLTASQELPDSVRDRGYGSVGAIADLLAQLAGGVSGATALTGAIGGAKALGRAAGRPFGQNIDTSILLDKSIPISQALESRPTKIASDRAAAELQAAVSDPGGPGVVLDRLRANRTELAPLPTQPSAAAMSEDQGLIGQQRKFDLRDQARAATREQQFRSGIRDTIDQLAPEGATAEPLIARAQAAADARIEQAQRGVDQASGRQRGVDIARANEAEGLPANPAEAKVAASRRVDTALVDQGYVPARADKNRLFNEAPGRAEMTDAPDVRAAADDVRARANTLRNPNEQMPTEFMARLDEVLGGEGGQVNVGALADMRPMLKDASERALRSGNLQLRDSIEQFRRVINQTIERSPGYAEANANYRGFADEWRPNPGDPMTNFTRQVDREPVFGGVVQRGQTPPEQTAGRFLDSGQPQDTGALLRGVNASPARDQGMTATREYLLADMAGAGVVDQRTGFIRPDRLQKWINSRADLREQLPEFHAEVTDMLARAQRGERLSGQLANEVAAANRNLARTRDAVDKGALGLVINADPDKAVAAVMNQKDRSGRLLNELIRLTENDPQARNGLKAAVRDYLVDKATTTATETLAPGDRRGPVSFAKLTTIFREHERELARIFSPEEMNTLQAGHRAMELANGARVRVTSGSDTAEKLFDRLRDSPLGRGLESALRLRYGALETGGKLATIRRMLPIQSQTDMQAQDLLRRAAFDPDVMELLLGRKVPVGSPQWNKRAQRLLAANFSARDNAPDDE